MKIEINRKELLKIISLQKVFENFFKLDKTLNTTSNKDILVDFYRTIFDMIISYNKTITDLNKIQPSDNIKITKKEFENYHIMLSTLSLINNLGEGKMFANDVKDYAHSWFLRYYENVINLIEQVEHDTNYKNYKNFERQNKTINSLVSIIMDKKIEYNKTKFDMIKKEICSYLDN